MTNTIFLFPSEEKKLMNKETNLAQNLFILINVSLGSDLPSNPSSTTLKTFD